MSEPLSKKLGLGKDERNEYSYNDCLDDLDQLSPDVEELVEIISESQLCDDAWKYNELCDDDLKFFNRHKYKLAQEIINQMGTWIKKG